VLNPKKKFHHAPYRAVLSMLRDKLMATRRRMEDLLAGVPCPAYGGIPPSISRTHTVGSRPGTAPVGGGRSWCLGRKRMGSRWRISSSLPPPQQQQGLLPSAFAAVIAPRAIPNPNLGQP